MRVRRCRFRFLMTSFTVVDECLGIYPTVTIMTDVSHYSGPVLPYGEELMGVLRSRFRFLMTSFTVVD